MSYIELKEEAIRLKTELSLLDYFFRLEKKSIVLFDGKHGKEYFFRYDHQKTGSISIKEQSNLWYDHSKGEGGDIIKAVQVFEQKTFVQAVNLLKSEKLDNSFSTINTFQRNKSYEINMIYDEIKHPALIRYISSRYLSQSALKGFVQEIHWTIGEKKYFAIGLKNEKEGYAVRSAFFKGNINDSGVSFLNVGNNPTAVKIFEGLIDFGSYRTLHKDEMFRAIVLNSTANLSDEVLNKISFLAKELPLHTYLDTDVEGRSATKKVYNKIPKAEDMMYLYPTHNGSDLNDFLINNKNNVTI